MPKCWNTIMQKSKKSGTLVQRFKGLSLMFVIGIRPIMLDEANGIGFETWIALECRFQNWVSCQIFQVWFPGLSAAACVLWLGLSFGFCIESIRSKKLSKDPWIKEFNIWFFHHDFQIFFHVFFCSQSYQSIQIFPYWYMHEILRIKHAQKDLKL